MNERPQWIRAGRMWLLEGHTLLSLNKVPWIAGEPSQAVHRPFTFGPDASPRFDMEAIQHYGPRAGCVCGLWGCKLNKGDKTIWGYVNSLQSFRLLPAVIGTVKLWGKIIEHKKGYRAEYGYPEMLFTFGPKADRIAVNLSELYGVPAERFTWEKWSNK